MTPTPVLLYVTDTMADWEPGYAIAHIAKPEWQREPGRYAVQTVAATSDPITTMGGVTIVPDTTFATVSPDTSAMLILPGGETWQDTDRHADALRAAAGFLDAGTPVAAICAATFGLAAAGLLDDRDHTSNAAVFLASSGYSAAERYREEPAVTDGPLITASGVHPVDFAVHIFAALNLYEPDVLDAWRGLYTTGDAQYFYTLAAA
jgi:putative intracellular protease/amidase